MPSRIFSPGVIRSIPSVKYATQAATKPSSTPVSLPKRDPKITTLPNGIVIASVENYAPVTKVSLSFKAGARCEDSSNLGITHCLRNCAGLSTKDATSFGITRNIQQIGGSLTTTVSREHFSYNLECNRDNAEFALGFLNQVVTKQAFKPWEVDDSLPRMKLDLVALQQQLPTIVMEQLHKAAFRTGLGNSLYSPSYNIGYHEPEMLKEFVKKNFTTNRLAVVGVGICHDYLVEYASKTLELESGLGSPPTASKYGGGEIRIETGSPLAHVAVATEGASLKNLKDVVALAILQHVLGVGHIKWSDGAAANKLAQVASKATDKPFAISPLNISYSDSGLFGFYCIAQSEEMAKVVKAVFALYSSLTKSGISETDLQIAKNRLKAAIGFSLESSSQLLDEFSTHAHTFGQLLSLEDVVKAIDAATANDVTTVAKKVINGKPSMAAVGNLSNTPYLDQVV